MGIDRAHSGIHFSVRHMVLAKVRGQFDRWSGTILADRVRKTGTLTIRGVTRDVAIDVEDAGGNHGR